MHDYSKLLDPEKFSIDLVWQVFAKAILPPDASRIQYVETKKAFYAGFLECFKVMTDYAGGLTESDACKLFNRLSAESHDFFEIMKRDHPIPKGK